MYVFIMLKFFRAVDIFGLRRLRIILFEGSNYNNINLHTWLT